jgi:hypothetical protein
MCCSRFAARLLQTICQSEWNNPKVAAADGVIQLQACCSMGGFYFLRAIFKITEVCFVDAHM